MSLPDYDDVQVNLEEEIEKLAARDGLENKKLLEITIQMTRREYYAASIIQWYRGRDQGFMEGVASWGTQSTKRYLQLMLVGVAIGAVLTFGITYILLRH